jgi:hypothetical protein
MIGYAIMVVIVVLAIVGVLVAGSVLGSDGE